MKRFLFTSESVTEGHPDKVCDAISDGILDAVIAQDPYSRVACECLVKSGYLLLAGEITTKAAVDYEDIARQVIRDIGYTDNSLAFSADNVNIVCKIEQQSPDIAMGVDISLEGKEGKGDNDIGAGDQGMMFGYACRETEELMPLAISLAHKLAKRLTKVRKDGTLGYLRPDGKSQVTVEYVDGKPVRIDAVVISSQHTEDVAIETLRDDIRREVILHTLPESLVDDDTRIYINPTGRFVIGGPEGDAGLTGRKIIVDTYGGAAPHGGGAFSGKDPTKVDRSAAYMARYIAKNVVAAGLADRCEVQLAYAIGVAKPVSVLVDTFGTAVCDDEKIIKAVNSVFDMRPSAIIDSLNLRTPCYRQLAALGHMGREDLDISFEKCDKADALKAAVESL